MARNVKRRNKPCYGGLPDMQEFLPAQGPHPGRCPYRIVPHDEADRGRSDVHATSRTPSRMRDGRQHAGYHDRSLLFQGRPRLEHAGRDQRGRHQRRSFAADREMTSSCSQALDGGDTSDNPSSAAKSTTLLSCQRRLHRTTNRSSDRRNDSKLCTQSNQ